MILDTFEQLNRKGWLFMNIKVMQIIFPITFVIGIVVILSCIDLGSNHAHNILMEHGGSMDTSDYMLYLQESIRTYRELGIALLITSALGEIVILNKLFDK
jgi:hypothetical protein